VTEDNHLYRREMFRRLLDWESAISWCFFCAVSSVKAVEARLSFCVNQSSLTHTLPKFTAEAYILTKEGVAVTTPVLAKNYRPQFYFRTTERHRYRFSCQRQLKWFMPGDQPAVDVELASPHRG